MLTLSSSHFDPGQPVWQDYLPFLQALIGEGFPTCDQLNALLPDGLSSESAQTIRFIASDQTIDQRGYQPGDQRGDQPGNQLGDQPYEQRIYSTGLVSTRPNNWHDLFNALVWMRFPLIKTAMNAMHYHAWSEQKDGRRGELRDALTLFDECGAILFSNELSILRALAERNWNEAFLNDDFGARVKLSICGHAILEKYLSPYKSMTAKALLLHVDADFMKLPKQEMLTCLDTHIARQLHCGTLLTNPACLAPLPLAGVPGWWPADQQEDATFYQDLQVFRPPPANLIPAPVISLL